MEVAVRGFGSVGYRPTTLNERETTTKFVVLECWRKSSIAGVFAAKRQLGGKYGQNERAIAMS